jgi:DNA polymerase-4
MAARLAAAGVVSMDRLLSLDARQARAAWGSVWGERMYWLLRGHDLPELETSSRSIGHSHVLGPEKRPLPAARLVTRRLLAKAATRLRRAGKRTARLGLSVKAENVQGQPPARWKGEVRVAALMDTPALLAALEGLWAQMAGSFGVQRLLQVGVVLSDLSEADAVQHGLFDTACAADEARRLALSEAMDKVNARFGRDAVTLGHDRLGAVKSAGPRIAFTRIPELAEFRE